MKLYKIMALVYNDSRIFRNMKYKPVELLYFPLTTVIIWGLFSIFVQDRALEAGLVVLVVNVFWQFAQTTQGTTNRAMMEDMWTNSLKHIFVSGITGTEYMAARMLYATIISIPMVALLLGVSLYVFGAQVIAVQLPAILVFVVLTLMASLALSVLVAGLVLTAGREYGFLTWTAIQIFVLLSAPFYPSSVFPPVLQPIISVMPFTNVFEGVRSLINTGTLGTAFIANSIAISAAYLVVSFGFYYYSFERARRNGNLARMAG